MKGSCSLFFRDRILAWLLGVSECLDADHVTREFPHSWKPRAAVLLSRVRASFVWEARADCVSTTEKLAPRPF